MWNKNDGESMEEREDGERHTNKTLMTEIFKILEAMPDFEKANAILDYGLVSSSVEKKLSSYEFDFLALPNFGGSEGIYLDCYIEGIYDEKGAEWQKKTTSFSDPFRVECATFKTLGTSLEDMKTMGELGGIITYAATKYINQNIKLFEPNITREDILLYDEAKKAEAQKTVEITKNSTRQEVLTLAKKLLGVEFPIITDAKPDATYENRMVIGATDDNRYAITRISDNRAVIHELAPGHTPPEIGEKATLKTDANGLSTVHSRDNEQAQTRSVKR